jgi:hypothetical protein
MDHLLGPKWVSSARRRPPRVGDLMVAVALTAIGISTVTVVELAGDKWLMGTFTFAFIGHVSTRRCDRRMGENMRMPGDASCAEAIR